jgi:hypothetical protein
MTGAIRREGGSLDATKIAVLIESDFFEPEIHYYERRFAEEGAEVHFLTRMWGLSTQTFTGHEWRRPGWCRTACATPRLPGGGCARGGGRWRPLPVTTAVPEASTRWERTQTRGRGNVERHTACNAK